MTQALAIDSLLNDCVREYKHIVGSVDEKGKAANDAGKRAYGGVVRMTKGKLVENVARKLVQAAWIKNGGTGKLDIKTGKFDIPIQREYVEAIKNEALKREIKTHIDRYKVRHGADLHIYLDGKFVLSIECKAFTENAMLKRILFDAYLLRTRHPQLRFALVQLESQLGGDYSDPLRAAFGSPQTHTLMSYMAQVELKIITLLEGERKVDRPIHKSEFYKPLKREHLRHAVAELAPLLAPA